MIMNQLPLSVYALFHSKNTEGRKIYSELYCLLCRDVKNPFMDGLDIPVFYATGDDKINRLVKIQSQKKVILVFIDINMFCAESWRKYIDEIIKNADKRTMVIAIKQYKHAFSMNKSLGETQSIVVGEEDGNGSISLLDKDNWEVFQTRLFDLLIRFISGKGTDALSVFISHSKRDKGNKGELSAKAVRDFLYSDTKLNSFFDVHDILDGYKFGDQIKNNVENSVLLILFTDTYSSREWCRIEALTAKEKQVPIVLVNMVEHKVDRTFPYIGNVPSISYKGDWRPIINLLLRTTLDQCYEKKLLTSLIADDTTEECLPYLPEAYNLSTIKKDTTKLLYPEPPLGNEELNVLRGICKQMDHDISFVTPMASLTSDLNLSDKKVAISVSENDELPSLGIGGEILKDLTVELTRHILKAGGHLVYGGDLRKDGYTELFKELSNQYGQKEKSDSDVVYIDNYLAWPLYNNLTLEQKAEFLNSRIQLIPAEAGDNVTKEEKSVFVPPCSLENRLKWATSLTLMRRQMAKVTNARIVISGRTSGFKGYMAGIAEEFMIATENKQPVYLIGGFGGVAHLLAEIIEQNTTSEVLQEYAISDAKYKEIFDWCQDNGNPIAYSYFDSIKISSLNNGLSEEENKTLFHSVDIMEIVSLVLKGLKNIIK